MCSCRKKFREEIIEKLELELNEIKDKINEIDNQIRLIDERTDILNNEYFLFPDKGDLETAFNEVMKAQLHYNNCLRNVEAKKKK